MRNLSLTKPPMGWNSFDCFDGSINEEHAMKNLEVFIEKFKPAGYEYFVIDIAWYRIIKDPKPNKYALLNIIHISLELLSTYLLYDGRKFLLGRINGTSLLAHHNPVSYTHLQQEQQPKPRISGFCSEHPLFG